MQHPNRPLAREGANSVSGGDSFSLGSKLEGGERAYWEEGDFFTATYYIFLHFSLHCFFYFCGWTQGCVWIWRGKVSLDEREEEQIYREKRFLVIQHLILFWFLYFFHFPWGISPVKPGFSRLISISLSKVFVFF